MSYCLNPLCTDPRNAKDAVVCHHCGDRLRLGDRYVALKPLGQGGFGRTFLASDGQDPQHRLCVIKQFFPQEANTSHHSRAVDLFRQEAERLRALGTHPQIPDLFDHLEQDGRQYLIQEFIDGRNLEQELAETNPFDEAKIRDLLRELLPVLKFIHDHQVIHRDIKPANIIRSRNEWAADEKLNSPTTASNPASGVIADSKSAKKSAATLFIVDLGAAKHATATAIERTGTAIGSAEFTAPEQARGKASFASDLYSLGATCIHLLTGVSPFELYDTGEGRWVWRDYLPQPVSKALGQILDRLLEPATKRRYQTVDQVLADFLQHLGDRLEPQSTQSSHPSSTVFVAKPSSNHSQNGHSQNGHSQNGHSQNSQSGPMVPKQDEVELATPEHPILEVQPAEPASIEPVDRPFKRTGHLESLEKGELPLGNNRRALLRGLMVISVLIPVGLLLLIMRGRSPSLPPQTLPPIEQSQSDRTAPDDSLYTLQANLQPRGELALSPDGQTVAIGDFEQSQQATGTVSIWDLNTSQVIRKFNQVSAIAIKNKPELRVVSNNDSIGAWQFINPFTGGAQGQLKGQLKNALFEVSDNEQTALSFELGDRTNPIFFSIWNLQTGDLINRFQTEIPPDTNESLRFAPPATLSPDGQKVAIARYSSPEISAIEVREIHQGALLHTLRIAQSMQRPIGFRFSPNGETLAVETQTGETNSQPNNAEPRTTALELWNLSNDTLLTTIAIQSNAAPYQFAADGQHLVVRHANEGLQVWECATGNKVQTIHNSTNATLFALSPDGYTLVWVDASNPTAPLLKVSEVRTGALIQTLNGLPPEPTHLVFSAGGDWVASGSANGLVKVWKIL